MEITSLVVLVVVMGFSIFLMLKKREVQIVFYISGFIIIIIQQRRHGAKNRSTPISDSLSPYSFLSMYFNIDWNTNAIQRTPVETSIANYRNGTLQSTSQKAGHFRYPYMYYDVRACAWVRAWVWECVCFSLPTIFLTFCILGFFPLALTTSQTINSTVLQGFTFCIIKV